MNGSIRIGTKIDTKNFDKQIEYLNKEIEKRENENMQFQAGLDDGLVEDLTRDLAESERKVKRIQNELKKVTGTSDRLQLEKDLSKAQTEVTELRNVLHEMPKQIEIHMKSEAETEKMKNQLVDLKNKANETSVSVNKVPKNISANFDKSFKSIRNLGGALISIRGAYGLLSKASQAYLETDDTTTKQIKANWIGLGSMLEPVIKLITDLMRKATTGVLYFMSCLTGNNYIEKANSAIMRANTKEIEKNTKAKKENLKFTAGFDEMNIASDTTSSNSSSSSSSKTQMPLFSISDIGESAKKSIEKIAGALNPIFDTVGDIIDWAKEHPGAVVAILGGMALVGLLGKIIGGPKTGLLGMSNLLTGLMTMGVISIAINVSTMIEGLNEARDETDKVDDYINSRYKQGKKEIESDKKKIPGLQKNSKEVSNLTNKYKENIDTLKSKNKVTLDTLNGYSKSELQLHNYTGTLQNNINTLQTDIKLQYQNLVAQTELYEQGKLNEEQIKQYEKSLLEFNEIMNGSGKAAQDTRKWYDYFGDSTEDLTIMQNYCKESLKGVGIQSQTTANIMNNTTTSTENMNNAINNIPSKKKVNVDATTVQTAKSKADDLLTSLSKIGKAKIKATVQLNFKYAGESVLGAKDEAFNNIMKALNSSTTKKYAATGAIVNNPGRGVPLTQDIITGEQGAEGVIPLTDMSAMETLGRTIGRYVNVSTTNVINLDNRTIARETKKVQNELDFANNWR